MCSMRPQKDRRVYSVKEIADVLGKLVPVGRFHQFGCAEEKGVDSRYTGYEKDGLYRIVVTNPYSQGFLSNPRQGIKEKDLKESGENIDFSLGDNQRLSDLSLADIMGHVPPERKEEGFAFETVLLRNGKVRIRFYR